jgi:hypothetical protein
MPQPSNVFMKRNCFHRKTSQVVAAFLKRTFEVTRTQKKHYVNIKKIAYSCNLKVTFIARRSAVCSLPDNAKIIIRNKTMRETNFECDSFFQARKLMYKKRHASMTVLFSLQTKIRCNLDYYSFSNHIFTYSVLLFRASDVNEKNNINSKEGKSHRINSMHYFEK